MTKQEQVDEMAKYICNACEMGHGFDGCSYGGREHYKRCSITQKTAKALYDAGYRKVPDGAVVLTPEDRDDEMKATNEILAERDDLKEKVESLKSEKEGWKMRYSDSGQKNKKLSIKNAQLKVEIEELKAELNARLTCDFVKTAQKHAVQNFAEKLKAKLFRIFGTEVENLDSMRDITYQIDELLKEYEK